MRIAYVIGAEQAEAAEAQVRALAGLGHDARVIDEVEDGFDLVVGRDVEFETVFRAATVVDEQFYRGRRVAENERPRVLLPGPSQIESRGIEDGYGAAAHARWFHQKFDLIRAAPWAPARDEPLDAVQEFHVALDVNEMARLLQTCDVVVAPSRSDDASNMAVPQALASGIPTLVTAVPFHQSFRPAADFALFAPAENAVELGEKFIELLTDRELRDRLRVRGREVAEQWRASVAAERLEAFLVERAAERQR
jgi:hypothetical protein